MKGGESNKEGVAMNLVTLQGRLARPAAERLLPSGDRMVGFEVSTEGPDGKTETVPVVWFAAPSSAALLDADDRVVVIGRVRRRFFRTGDSTQSRTEVVAEIVLPATQAKRVKTALQSVASKVAQAAE
jgi:single-strand DNA-binding protein